MTKTAKEKMKKRHKKISRVRRQRRFRFLIIVAVFVLLGIGAFELYYSSFFNIKKVKVLGNKHLSSEKVVKIADITAETSLLRLPVKKMEDAILSERWVKSVEFTRRFPDTLEVKITERIPQAAIVFKDEYVLVDNNNVVIDWAALDKPQNLPKIKELDMKKPAIGKKVKGKSFENAMGCIRGLDSELEESLNFLLASSVDLLTLVTKNDIEILYGEATQTEKKNQIIKEIFDKRGDDIIFIDVRVVSNPVVRSL